jgi:hypothetical protein
MRVRASAVKKITQLRLPGKNIQADVRGEFGVNSRKIFSIEVNEGSSASEAWVCNNRHIKKFRKSRRVQLVGGVRMDGNGAEISKMDVDILLPESSLSAWLRTDVSSRDCAFQELGAEAHSMFARGNVAARNRKINFAKAFKVCGPDTTYVCAQAREAKSLPISVW